jgi:amino acid transporter
MLGLVIPFNDPNLLCSSGTASQSPFIITATYTGIKAVPSIINAVVLTLAWSSSNLSILGGSCILYSLVVNRYVPAFFKRINHYSIPYLSVGFFSLFMCLGYLSLSSSASTAF